HVHGLGGTVGHVVLEELEHPTGAEVSPVSGYEMPRPHARGLFTLHADDQAGFRAVADQLSPPGTPGAARVAFVYPGLGNQFAGMGRELSVLWPDVVRQLEPENSNLRDQFDPAVWWAKELPRAFADHRIPILGTVWVGRLVTAILRRFGVNPQAAIGYSM